MTSTAGSKGQTVSKETSGPRSSQSGCLSTKGVGQGGVVRMAVGATASAVPPPPTTPLTLSSSASYPWGGAVRTGVGGVGWGSVRPPASALPPHPLRPQPFPSQHPPVLGFLGPDTTEVIIQLLSIQWNSHKVTSGVKRNKIENKIHPDC